MLKIEHNTHCVTNSSGRMYIVLLSGIIWWEMTEHMNTWITVPLQQAGYNYKISKIFSKNLSLLF